MAVEKIIQAVLSLHPDVTQAQILEELEVEKCRTGGLIADETLLRVIAARYGVQVPQAQAFNCSLSISNLIPILNDVSVVGRIVAVYPIKTFEGKQSGKYGSLVIADKDCLLRVLLWNDKASLIESGELKIGQVVRFSHGYTREDRSGKTELHLGRKSLVDVSPQDVDSMGLPFISKFLTKCSDITDERQDIHLAGNVKRISPLSKFTRQDQTTGQVLRFVLVDVSGEVTVVAWNGKATELEALLTEGGDICLVNAKVKSGPNGKFEVHVDAATFVDFSASSEQ